PAILSVAPLFTGDGTTTPQPDLFFAGGQRSTLHPALRHSCTLLKASCLCKGMSCGKPLLWEW
ncbi:hypothetical protein M8C21_031932, partial [Ambrosia artemisiifolia]